MKKILSVLSLIAIVSMTTPAFAAPHGGPGGHGPGGPRGGIHHARPHGGPHHVSTRHHGPHGGFSVHAGSPRHRHWGHYGISYWGGHRCDYRLGYYAPYGPYPYYCSPYMVPGASFSIRF